MKKMNMAVMAGLALAASAAHAGTTTLDFEGFTISFSAAGMWDQASKVGDTITGYASDTSIYDPVTGTTSFGRYETVRANDGVAAFTTSAPPELESYHGLGNASSSLSFSYTIAAKPNWELLHTDVVGSQGGSYFGYKGGVVTVAGSGTGSQAGGGRPIQYYSNGIAGVSGIPYPDPGPLTAGSFSQGVHQEIRGNYIANETVWESDGQGGVHVGKLYRIDGYTNPLTSVSGQVVLNLGVSSSGTGQVAYLAANQGSLRFDIRAARGVSPVPEPESYAMVLASLGLFGVIARRKKS